MRWSLIVLAMMCACEAQAPTFAPIDAGQHDTVDPYGDGCEPAPPTPDEKCRANDHAPLNGKCLLYSAAALDCMKVKGCYSTKHATCVTCAQP